MLTLQRGGEMAKKREPESESDPIFDSSSK
jgi:hypothetical protein